MQSIEARAVAVVDVILRVLLVLPHVLFLATPHEQSREYAPLALEHGIRVVDLSGVYFCPPIACSSVKRMKR